ncbi:1936_t:CDS:2 [Paraglomus occultum]|uniref:1936_t:CDS:1 n=1 Tax=Paraglomus occultum TaxID=144539 RepID=A0A9N9G552_9GLOM|nr:1936_t:CDS:2 [Paraglomus occultum]
MPYQTHGRIILEEFWCLQSGTMALGRQLPVLKYLTVFPEEEQVDAGQAFFKELDDAIPVDDVAIIDNFRSLSPLTNHELYEETHNRQQKY